MPVGEAVFFDTVDKGEQSQIIRSGSKLLAPLNAELSVTDDIKVATIASQGDWTELWLQHTSGILPAPEIPSIDFSKEMVVGVFSGIRPTAGYGITVTSIKRNSSALLISIVESVPRPGRKVAQVVTYPYHIVRFNRADLPIKFTLKIEQKR